MEQPSKIWKDYLHESGGMEKAAKASYDNWLNKYAKHKQGEEEPKDKFKEKLLIPGKIYTFFYLSQEKINEKTQFIDHRPVALSIGHKEINKKVFETCIDFNAIPFKPRIFILDRLFKHYKATINMNESNIDDDKEGRKALKIDYDTCKKIFDKLGWELAFMMFDRAKMGQIKPIDYDDWVSIIPLYTRSIRGKQIKDIYAEYIKNMTNPKIKIKIKNS